MSRLPYGPPRVAPLGIADLRLVRQELLGYEPGEVAHLENVMAGEFRERVHRSLALTETTLDVEEFAETESSRDLESAERFEIEREVRRELQAEENLQVGVRLTAGYGPVSLGVSTNYGSSSSRTEEQRSATRYAKEMTERASERVRESLRERRQTRQLNETEETNTHRFSNEAGEGRAGVYRWVDKRYRNRVVSYGRRLMYEFYVPEPASYYRHVMASTPGAGPPAPPTVIDPDTGELIALRPDLITTANYLTLAGEHQATGVPPPLPSTAVVSLPLARAKERSGSTPSSMRFAVEDNVEIPDGYCAIAAVFKALTYTENVVLVTSPGGAGRPEVNSALVHAVIGNHSFYLTFLGDNPYVEWWRLNRQRDKVAVSVSGLLPAAVTFGLTIYCQLTSQRYAEWQLDVFEQVIAAHNQRMLEYEDELARRRGGLAIGGRPPAVNRAIIAEEFRRAALNLWLGGHDVFPPAVSYPPGVRPEIDMIAAARSAPIARFLDDAFEWDNATHILLPYHFGPPDRWSNSFAQSDPDPLFEAFLRAGAARVLVPVRPEATAAVLWAQATGELWEGSDPPTFAPDSDEARYLALLAGSEDDSDLVDLHADVPLPDDEATWDISVPTTLIWLQPGSELP